MGLKKFFKKVSNAVVDATGIPDLIEKKDPLKLLANLATAGGSGALELSIEGAGQIGSQTIKQLSKSKQEPEITPDQSAINRSKGLEDTLQSRRSRAGAGRAGTILTSTRNQSASLI